MTSADLTTRSGYRYDLEEYTDYLERRVEQHRVGDGLYQRHIHRQGQTPAGAADAYGTTDAANILYTLARLPGDARSRAAFVAGIRSFQNPDTGEFDDPTHSAVHTTAHSVAALELFDARPEHPLSFLHELVEVDGDLERFLDDLPWSSTPWPGSHSGAGIEAALSITGEAPARWHDRYFRWLEDEVDPRTGLWRRDRMLPIGENPGLFGNLAGTFHYHFDFVAARRVIPYPERVIDTCLDLLEHTPVPLGGPAVGFKDVDWVFCVGRASRQSGYRHDEVIAALETVCDRVVGTLADPGHWESDDFDDLHSIFGGLCTVSELQIALPGSIRTRRPLRQVLDRRPFI